MLLLMFLTFLLTTALYGALLVFALRRITAHVQGNFDATQAVAEHILVPLFGRKPKVSPEEEEPDTSLTEVPALSTSATVCGSGMLDEAALRERADREIVGCR
jgi:hypothetical protein